MTEMIYFSRQELNFEGVKVKFEQENGQSIRFACDVCVCVCVKENLAFHLRHSILFLPAAPSLRDLIKTVPFLPHPSSGYLLPQDRDGTQDLITTPQSSRRLGGIS